MAIRNPDASKPNRGSQYTDPFLNPVGSVGSSDYRETPLQTERNYVVYGEGGKARHQGNFSDSNPYFEQLMLANNNQDKDALYEHAIQWEADYANLQEQREYNRGVLEEQREYDSPVNQIARARAAGINPDISGSSGSTSSGSGAQMQIPQMADQTGQTKFSNKYDNTSLVFEGINTAANFAGTLTSGVSNIMNAVSNMKMVPSQIALNEAHANLSGAQANEIKELLSGKKKALDLSNAAQGISNSTAILQQLAGFAELISPDTPDFASTLASLGVAPENVAPYTDIIKQMHANPVMRNKYAKASTAAKFSEAENDKYTQDLVSGMVDLQYKMEYEALDLEYHRNHLANKISSLLDTDDFASDSAELEMGKVGLGNQSVSVKSEEMALRFEEVKNDTAAFLTKLEQKANAINGIKAARDHIYELAKDRSLTSEETAMINRLNAEEMSMYSLASSEFNQIKTAYLRAGQALYDRYRRLDGAGNMKALAGQEQYNFYSDLTFNDIITHGKTAGEIANQWVNTAIDAAGVGAQAYTGYRIGKIGNKESMTSNYKYNPVNGRYEIQDGSVTTTGRDVSNHVDVFEKKRYF